MAYQTGSANNITELLTKLADFAKDLGWVVDKLTDKELYLHNTDGYWSMMLYRDNKFYTYVNTGFDKDKSADAQPGTNADASRAYRKIETATTQLHLGNYVSYDFFGAERYLHVVVQISAEKFRHFGVGTLDKEGEYVGGQYTYGTFITDNYGHYQNSDHAYGFSNGAAGNQAVVRADGISGDTKTPWYFAPTGINDFREVSDAEKGKYLLSLGRASMYYEDRTYHPDNLLVVYSQSKFGQALIPCPHSLIAHGIDGIFRRLGILPDRYECTMRDVMPRQILSINGDKWMIIPSAQYDGRNANYIEEGKNNSGLQGVAYRIIE
jgi:hypothetical protein